MPGKHHLRGFKIAKTIGSPLRGSWTMVSIALVDARKTSLTGVQNSTKKSARRFARLVDDGLHCVSRCQENLFAGGTKKSARRFAARGRGVRMHVPWPWVKPPPLGKKLDPPLDVITDNLCFLPVQGVNCYCRSLICRGGGGGARPLAWVS